MSNPPEFLTTEQLAERWGISPRTLEARRARGDGPQFVRIGRGRKALVRYRLSAILEYELTNTTGEPHARSHP